MSLTLAKAVHAITGMYKLEFNSILTKDELLELWTFIDDPIRIPMSRSTLKIQLTKECGVFVEQLDSVMGDATLAQVLVWESSRCRGKGFTLHQIKTILQSPPDTDWILPLCNKMNTTEAEFVWRWALNERWRSIRNRMIKWLHHLLYCSMSQKTDYNLKFTDFNPEISIPNLIEYIKGHKNEGVNFDTLLKATQFKRLKKWISTHTQPDKWWLVKDAGNLRHVDSNGVVRYRNGDLDLVSISDGKGEEHWMFETFNNISVTSLATDVQNIEWGECVNLIHHHSQACILIHDSGDYHILSSGTVSLYAQLLTVRNIRKNGFELQIGFRDGFEIVEVDTIYLEKLPFELQQSLQNRKVYYHNNHQRHDIPDGMVVKIEQSWHPEEGWYLRYVEYCPSKGVSDVDEINDYNALVRYNDESE